MHVFNIRLFAISLLFCGYTTSLPHTPKSSNLVGSDLAVRSANTCADTSLAQTVYQAFKADSTIHVLNYRHAYENANTQSKAVVWADLHPSFRAWPTQQNFTVPLFQLGTADRTQYIYRIGTDAQTPPVVSGFNTDIAVVAWVYNTQVCDSVPLMSASLASFTDHYVTITAFEHDRLISDDKWADEGTIAFVLPLYSA